MTSPTVTTAFHYLMFEKHQNIYSQGDEEGDKGGGVGVGQESKESRINELSIA